MARRTSFSIKIDIDPVVDFAGRLGELTPEQMGRAVVDAINETADSAYELGRKTILQGINLTDSYIQRKMQVDHATEKKPTASITAFGGRAYLTSLSHYGAMQLTKDVNWTNSRIAAMGRPFGPWPGWTKRKGNAAIGIPVDKKADGRSVEVVQGRRKRMGPAFSIPGKVDGDGTPIIFTRRSGKVQALTGPSVYQLFRVAAEQIEPSVADDLMSAVSAAAEANYLKELT